VCGGDAAFLSNYSDHLFFHRRLIKLSAALA